MAKTLTSMLDYVAKLPRSGFDMSQSFAFSASTGMILPVYSDFLTSSESVSLTTDFFARTQPLVTAAMADVDIYLDWFFVPMTMLYTPWGQIRWQTDDFVTSLVTKTPANNNADFYRKVGFPLVDVSASLNCYNSSSALSYNRSAFFSVNAGNPSSSNSAYSFDSNFDCMGKSLFRVADMLGYNPYGVIKQDPNASNGAFENSWNPNIFPYKALAYQCIYQNYYRNDDYERRDVSCYNYDWLFNIDQAVTFAGDPRNPFILRYADYRRDYFTSVKPSPILSAVNLLEGSTNSVLQQINNYLADSQSVVAGNSGSNNSFEYGELGSDITQVVSRQGTNDAVLSTGNLRSLFAVEKLLRITGRAAKTYDAQTLAHFGFKVPHDVKHDITHLHSSHGMLHIGEVISTADSFNGSSGSALGEIAGKGYVSIHDDKRVKFTAPVDGVLMCCFRAIPRLRVGGSFDRQNAVANRTDIFIPEFDKLGMQPLYQYEFDPLDQSHANRQCGWQIRYQQFKQKYDRVSSVFTQEAGAGSVNQFAAWVLYYHPFMDFSAFGSFTPSRAGNLFKCPPTALNSIMVVPYVTRVSTNFAAAPAIEFYTDPFICDFRANVKKVSPMSPTGEPDMITL